MRLALLFTLAVLLFSSVRGLAQSCPSTELGETQEDCPWAGLARGWSEIADQGQVLFGKIQSQAPMIAKQLANDSKLESWKSLWGKSINYDEFAKGIILHPAIYSELERAFRTAEASDGKIVHAGLEHTYGYLFSILKTPFGFKRARWVRGEIEQGFGLPKGLLGPNPSEGSLFANLTYFAGRIALRDSGSELKVLEKNKIAAAKAIRGFAFHKVAPTRLEETIGLPSRKVVLRTDFVPFLHKPSAGNTFLLIYSVQDGAKTRLITAFPVGESFVDKAHDQSQLGENQPIVTRYNAHVDGITGTTHTGERRLLMP